VFHRLGDGASAKPAQVLLLPGILSSGPDLKDLDGDGKLDLWLSVFGEDLKTQVARRLTGRVALDYYAYRGTGEPAPFRRSPDLKLTDSLPEATFLDWSLRHRLSIDDDWSGDGRPDLIEVATSGKRTTVSVRIGVSADAKLGFAQKALVPASLESGVREYRVWRLSANEPALTVRRERGGSIVTPSR
jgi:hypothetical protein